MYRVYLFEKSDFDEGKQEAFGLNAYNAEQLLHRMVDDKFNPKQVRLNFSNGQKSEWWNIKDKQMYNLVLIFVTKKFCWTHRFPLYLERGSQKPQPRKLIFLKEKKSCWHLS